MIHVLLRRLALAALMFAVVPLAHAQTPSGCGGAMPAVPGADDRGPANLGVLKIALVRYRCTEYDKDVEAVLAEARA